jgi:hypothetical protein
MQKGVQVKSPTVIQWYPYCWWRLGTLPSLNILSTRSRSILVLTSARIKWLFNVFIRLWRRQKSSFDQFPRWTSTHPSSHPVPVELSTSTRSSCTLNSSLLLPLSLIWHTVNPCKKALNGVGIMASEINEVI